MPYWIIRLAVINVKLLYLFRRTSKLRIFFVFVFCLLTVLRRWCCSMFVWFVMPDYRFLHTRQGIPRFSPVLDMSELFEV